MPRWPSEEAPAQGAPRPTRAGSEFPCPSCLVPSVLLARHRAPHRGDARAAHLGTLVHSSRPGTRGGRRRGLGGPPAPHPAGTPGPSGGPEKDLRLVWDGVVEKGSGSWVTRAALTRPALGTEDRVPGTGPWPQLSLSGWCWSKAPCGNLSKLTEPHPRDAQPEGARPWPVLPPCCLSHPLPPCSHR